MSEHNQPRENIFSKTIKAKSRTYYFDVKATRNNQQYIIVTESVRRNGDNGDFFFQKHKVMIYPEDFSTFVEMFQECVDFIQSNPQAAPPQISNEEKPSMNETKNDGFSDVSFEDLGK